MNVHCWTFLIYFLLKNLSKTVSIYVHICIFFVNEFGYNAVLKGSLIIKKSPQCTSTVNHIFQWCRGISITRWSIIIIITLPTCWKKKTITYDTFPLLLTHLMAFLVQLLKCQEKGQGLPGDVIEEMWSCSYLINDVTRVTPRSLFYT